MGGDRHDFHRGIAPDIDLAPGDSEMRFAFETYMTLQDAGERARPRTLASERLRAASKAESSNTGMDDTHRRTPSHTSNLTQEPAQLGEDGDGDSLTPVAHRDELDRLAEDDDSDSLEGRRARARALHRNERGAAQIKGFRTLTWMKTNAEDGVAKMREAVESRKAKRIGKMEAEGISHF